MRRFYQHEPPNVRAKKLPKLDAERMAGGR
jgi:hypothetical protein